MTFKAFKSVTAIALALGYAGISLAQGGNDPIEGIDIIIKRDALCHPRCPGLAGGSFTPDQLKKINSLKGMDRPSYMAMIGAQYAQKATEGAQPKGGWEDVFKRALVENWNPEEKGGSTTVRAQTGKQAYKVTFTVQAEGDLKGDVQPHKDGKALKRNPDFDFREQAVDSYSIDDVQSKASENGPSKD